MLALTVVQADLGMLLVYGTVVRGRCNVARGRYLDRFRQERRLCCRLHDPDRDYDRMQRLRVYLSLAIVLMIERDGLTVTVVMGQCVLKRQGYASEQGQKGSGSADGSPGINDQVSHPWHVGG